MTQQNREHRAKKSLGQNFLQDQNTCRRIVEAIDIHCEDRIIEIGPGQGALTRFIIESGPAQYTALELDDDLAHALQSQYPHMNVIQTDALRYDWGTLNDGTGCKIVGNLPYNVGSKLIWDIVSRVRFLKKAVFMVQHEVALRLTAQPSSKAYGGLTAWVHNFAETKYLFKVPPTVFRPRPKVDSAVVSFSPLPVAQWPERPTALSALIKQLFQKRRKQISTTLKKEWSPDIDVWLENNSLSPQSRPENLSPSQFRELAALLK